MRGPHTIKVGTLSGSVNDWARINNLKPNTIRKRITRYGWLPALAVTTPVGDSDATRTRSCKAPPPPPPPEANQ